MELCVWAVINSVVTALFDLVLWPVRALPETLQLAWLALPAALLALAVFRWVTNQDAIEAAKDKVKAYLLELRLYRDDLGVTLRAQREILRWNLVYLRYSLVALVVMIVPFVLMIVQIETRYAFRPLRAGETSTLTVEVDRDGRQSLSALNTALAFSDGLEQDTPPLRIEPTGEIVWRLRARSAGAHRVEIHVGAARTQKQILVDLAGGPITASVYRADDLRTLTSPGEAPLPPEGGVRAVHLEYPRGRGEFLGLSSATWIFFAASLVFGYLLRRPLGVTF